MQSSSGSEIRTGTAAAEATTLRRLDRLPAADDDLSLHTTFLLGIQREICYTEREWSELGGAATLLGATKRHALNYTTSEY